MSSIKKLEDLIKERDILLKKHKDISYPTEKEMVEYIKNNQLELSRLNEIQKEIKKLEWELMSEKERQEHLEYLQKLKEKYADD